MLHAQDQLPLLDQWDARQSHASCTIAQLQAKKGPAVKTSIPPTEGSTRPGGLRQQLSSTLVEGGPPCAIPPPAEEAQLDLVTQGRALCLLALQLGELHTGCCRRQQLPPISPKLLQMSHQSRCYFANPAFLGGPVAAAWNLHPSSVPRIQISEVDFLLPCDIAEIPTFQEFIQDLFESSFMLWFIANK